MELKEIFKFFGGEKIKLLITFLVGGILGVGVFFLIPDKFVAKGTFYISRTPEEKERSIPILDITDNKHPYCTQKPSEGF